MWPIYQNRIPHIDMTKQYKYSLQKGSSKNICPECGKRTFVRYVDNVTGKCLPSQYGRCDREIKCGFHNIPKTEKSYEPYKKRYKLPERKAQLLTPIPFEVLAETLTNYEQNIFIQNLLQRVAFPFDLCDIEAVIAQYYLGTVACYGGAIALPFIDIKNNIRAIQVKQFDEANHTTKTSFINGIIKYQYLQRGSRTPDWLQAYELNDLKVSCLFGEHLLNKYPFNPIALVEAPKSAIYGTLYFGLPNLPERLIWLAVYNLSSLNADKCKALTGRDVVLFPDLSKDGKAFALWKSKLDELNAIKGARFTISDLLECNASEAEKLGGYDIADYLISQDWRLYRESIEGVKREIEIKDFTCTIETKTNLSSEKGARSDDQKKHSFLPPLLCERDNRPQLKQNWNIEISKLEKYFAAVELPRQPVRLNQYTTITNLPLFIESHLSTLKANNGRQIFLPHIHRLQELKRKIENNET
jgi:hypothetical protein